MKKLFALTVVLLAAFGFTQVSFAGPERYASKEVQPMVPPECNWTGWYIGGHVGYGWGANTWEDTTDENPGEIRIHQTLDGVFGGVQLGYNRQVNDWLVLGMEVSGAYSGIDDKTVRQDQDNSDIEPDTFKTHNDWNGTVAVRAGFTGMNNHALFYGKVGAAITHWNYSLVHDETFESGKAATNGVGTNALGQPEFDRFSGDAVRTVPMFGLGMEYMFNCHWSAKIEYQHLFLGKEDITGTWVEDFEDDEFIAFKHDLNEDSVQVGFNYHF